MACSIVNSTDESITCAICLDFFEDPRLLPCSHTYCHKCIKKCASHNKGQFVCPLNDGIIIPDNEIDSLPLNRNLRDIVDLERGVSAPASCQASNQCSNCDSAEVEFECDRCEGDLYCSKCFKEVHAPRVMQKHKRIPISDKTSKMIPCEIHDAYKRNWWCHTCRILGCPICMLSQHKTHDCNDLENLQSRLADARNKLETHTTEIDADKESMHTVITEAAASFRRIIDECKETMLQKVSSIDGENKKVIEESKTESMLFFISN